MKHLQVGQQQAVADPLQQERLLRALKISLEHQEANHASRTLCQGLHQSTATGGHDRESAPVAQALQPAIGVGSAARA